MNDEKWYWVRNIPYDHNRYDNIRVQLSSSPVVLHDGQICIQYNNNYHVLMNHWFNYRWVVDSFIRALYADPAYIHITPFQILASYVPMNNEESPRVYFFDLWVEPKRFMHVMEQVGTFIGETFILSFLKNSLYYCAGITEPPIYLDEATLFHRMSLLEDSVFYQKGAYLTVHPHIPIIGTNWMYDASQSRFLKSNVSTYSSIQNETIPFCGGR